MTDLITVEAIEESISDAYDEAQRGNNERANIRAELAQAQVGILLVEQIGELTERMDKLLVQLKRWDCGDQLAVSVRQAGDKKETLPALGPKPKPREMTGGKT